MYSGKSVTLGVLDDMLRGVRFGLLHRIPVTELGQNNDNFPSPHESSEGEYEEQQLFVPADTHANAIFDVQGLWFFGCDG